MKLFLIRHGQSEANVDCNVYQTTPDFNIDLTLKGINQALTVSSKLKDKLNTNETALLIHSPWHRAKLTAQYINEKVNLNIKECPLIYEQFYKPSFNSLSTEHTSYTEESLSFGKYWYKEGNMESYNDCYQRAVKFYMLLKTGYYKYVQQLVIVSHGVFLKCLLGVIDQLSVREIENHPDIENCCLIERSI